MDEAERCHRLAYIAYGSILTCGTVQEVIRHAGLHTWSVEGPELAKLASQLRPLKGVEQVAAFGTLLHVSGPDEQLLKQAIAPLPTCAFLLEQVPIRFGRCLYPPHEPLNG